MRSLILSTLLLFFFFFNDTATTEIYTLSLHDALPICHGGHSIQAARPVAFHSHRGRSEEHTSELQSRPHLVCRLLLEKKNNIYIPLFFIQKKQISKTRISRNAR